LTYPPARFDRLSTALPKWEGGWSVDGCNSFPRIILFEEGLGFSPVGERGLFGQIDIQSVWEYIFD